MKTKVQALKMKLKMLNNSYKSLTDQFGLEDDKILYDEFGNPRWLEFVRSDYG